MRRFLYDLLRLFGDINAIAKGRVIQRVQNRMLYKAAGKMIRRVTR
jgi:hypothetical protein